MRARQPIVAAAATAKQTASTAPNSIAAAIIIQFRLKVTLGIVAIAKASTGQPRKNHRAATDWQRLVRNH
jgi:hypothetical protein